MGNHTRSFGEVWANGHWATNWRISQLRWSLRARYMSNTRTEIWKYSFAIIPLFLYFSCNAMLPLPEGAWNFRTSIWITFIVWIKSLIRMVLSWRQLIMSRTRLLLQCILILNQRRRPTRLTVMPTVVCIHLSSLSQRLYFLHTSWRG